MKKSTNSGKSQTQKTGSHDPNNNKSVSETQAAQRSFGFIINVRDNFGFIQPYDSEEHIYYSTKDADRVLKEYDEVEFSCKNSPKGPAAVNVCYVHPECKVKALQLRGIVKKEYDAHRFYPGVIEIHPDSANGLNNLKYVCFLQDDVKDKFNKKVMKEDDVQFDVFLIPNSSYSRATNINITLTRREKVIEEQVRSIVASGAEREQGVIETIKGDYGFIKGVDRSELVFFRLEDLFSKFLPNESDEVQFYVIPESVKGKISNRAVQVSILPHGTVQFEKVIASNVPAMIVSEPKLYPREEPGRLRIVAELYVGGDILSFVELWPRCTPDGFVGKVGDKLLVDIAVYRPDKIIFAKAIKAMQFRPLGRQYGTICELPQKTGYAFIRPAIGNADIYFRTSEVVGLHGKYLSDDEITANMNVSFDPITEDTGSRVTTGTPRLRAIRVSLEKNQFSTRILLKKGIKGVIVKDHRKDTPGLIRVLDSEKVSLNSNDLRTVQSELIHGLNDFFSNPDLKDVVIEHLPDAQKRILQLLIWEHYDNVAYESIASANIFRIFKLPPQVYTEWKLQNADAVRLFQDDNFEKNRTISFFRSDIIETFEPSLITLGCEINFDIYLDKSIGIYVAANIVVKDELVNESGINIGVVDGKFLRNVATDERFPYSINGVSSATLMKKKNKNKMESPTSMSDSELKLDNGDIVQFDVRCKGDIRYASNLELIDNPQNFLIRDYILNGYCVGMVVERNFVVPIDVSTCPELKNRMVDLTAFSKVAKQARGDKMLASNGEGNSETWKKFSELNISQNDFESRKTSSNQQPCYLLPVNERNLPAGKRVFYPILPAIPLQIKVGDNNNLQGKVINGYIPIGTLISFQVVVNWSVQRSPLHALVSEAGLREIAAFLSQNVMPPCNRIVGYISKAKIPITPGVDLVEISSPSTNEIFYADSRELVSNSASPHYADQVDFYPLSSHSLAIVPLLMKSAQPLPNQQSTVPVVNSNICEARLSINPELKATNVIKGHKGITMAEGPPDDKATGFPSGWRTLERIDSLPWAHLLSPLHYR